jgi:hypothetical protein
MFVSPGEIDERLLALLNDRDRRATRRGSQAWARDVASDAS